MSNENNERKGWFYDYANGNKRQTQAEIVNGCLAQGTSTVECVKASGSIDAAAQAIARYAADNDWVLWDQDGDEYDIADFVEGYLEDVIGEAAEQRVNSSEVLSEFEDVLVNYDWPNLNDHRLWVATATEADILEWASVVDAEGN